MRNFSSKAHSSKVEVVTLILISAKVDAMSNRLDKLNVNIIAVAYSSNSTCEICSIVDHITTNCYVGSPFAQDTASEQVHALGNFTPRPQFNPNSSSFNPG